MARIRKKALIVLAVILVMCVVPCFAKRREKTITKGGVTCTAIWDDKHCEEYEVMYILNGRIDGKLTLKNVLGLGFDESKSNFYFFKNILNSSIDYREVWLTKDNETNSYAIIEVLSGYNKVWYDYKSAKADFNSCCAYFEKII